MSTEVQEPKRKSRVLLIEDESGIRRLMRASLVGTDFRLLEAESGHEGIEIVAKHSPHIVLLDLGLPDIEGIEVIRTIRGWTSVPIIVLSARGQENQKVECLEAGADDYVTKPFGVSELVARIRAAIRRTAALQDKDENAVFEFGDLKIDMSSRRVSKAGEDVHLTPIEYKLLCVLVRHAGKVVTHRQLLTEVWGAEYSEEAQYLRVYMGYLRRKIETSAVKPKTLLTEPRVGYRLAV